MPRLSLRTLLLLMNFFVLVVPLAGIYVFRLYENELVRQTESELIAQGAYIAALYKQAITPLIQGKTDYGIPVSANEAARDEKYSPIEPMLDLSGTKLLPQRPDSVPASDKPDTAALQAAQAIFPVLQEATLTTLAGVRITDFRGIVIAGREETGLSLAAVDEVAIALKGKYAAALRKRTSQHETPALGSISRGTNIRVFVAMPIIAGHRVLGVAYLSRAPRNILKGLFDDRETVMMASGIILAITALLALVTSYAISRPIYALIGQTQRIGRGEKDIRPIEEPVTREIALLSENIADMARTIAQRSDYIRNFAMHVSHEFKTPLTAIQGAIELIQEHGATMSREQLGKFLANTNNDTERLKKLVTRLLELARADVMQPRDETCDLTAELKKLQDAYKSKGLSVMQNAPQAILLPLPTEIVQTILGNLLENSRQHGASAVTINATSVEGAVEITVSDNGNGVSSANAEKLFRPFFTTNRDGGGTGLGLVIIRSMLSAYGGTIRHIPTESGARFAIRIITAP
jgi:signal transduction histidine kinase